MGRQARLKVTSGSLQGEILVAGQRAKFEVTISDLGVKAAFDAHPLSEAPVDNWQLLRALETFIEENLRG